MRLPQVSARWLGLLAALTAGYYVAGWFGLHLALTYVLASPIWLSTGLALAATLLLGGRIWPSVFAGALLVNLHQLVAAHLAWGAAIPAALAIATGNTLENVAGAWLINRYAHGLEAFRKPQSILQFALAAALACALSASIGSVTAFILGTLARHHPLHFWLTWWLGDLASAIVLTPCAVLWLTQSRPRLNLKRLVEASIMLCVLVVVAWATFSGLIAARTGGGEMAFLVVPPLLWAALRFGPRSTAALVLALAFIACRATLNGSGPFALPERLNSMFVLHGFLGVITLMSLMLAADVEQRRHMENGLRVSEQRYRELCTNQQRDARRATAFSELGRRLSAATSPPDAARIIAEAADVLFGWDACILDLCSSDQNTLETVFCADTIAGKRQEFSLPGKAPRDFAQEVMRSGARLLLRPDPPLFDTKLVPVGNTQRPSASLMYVPLREEHQAIGILSIQSYQPKAYTEEDLSVLQALAEHCSGALTRIRAESEIQRLNRELHRHLEEMQTIFNVAPVGIALSRDPQCRTLTGNPACQALFGANGVIVLSENGANEGQLPFRLRRQGQDVSFSEMPMQRVARQGQPVRGEELDLVFPDGRVVNSIISASPLYDDAGRLRGSLAVIVDMTERKRAEQEILRLNAQLEQRVRQRTNQLEAINKELEAFCYSVSHDLRAPLRSIRGFSEVLLERYAGNLDTRGQEFLRRVCQSSAQMDLLIEDLLKLSRVSRSELQRRNVPLSQLASDIVGELSRAEPGRSVECVIAPQLEAQGDEGLLRIVLENLLRNAWKFTAKQPHARIEFGFVQDPKPAFFVRDNGAGFDMAHADRLFGVFQRLHSASEFPGTGVGLATVQRIINRHGGRTWAQGAPEAGATFYFTLPGPALC